MPKRRVKKRSGRYRDGHKKEIVMSEGTAYVVEQLGLALKAQQEAYSQLMAQAQQLQQELESLRGEKSEAETPQAEELEAIPVHTLDED